MAQFAGLIPNLDPYGGTFNAERARRVSMPRRKLSSPDVVTGLSIIVLHKERPELLERLWTGFTKLRELFEREGILLELLLGDTGTTNPEALEFLEKPPSGVTIFRGMTYHFSRCNNDLFEHALFATVLFMNNDVFIDQNPEGVLEAYREHLKDPGLGAVGIVMLFEDGNVQHAGVELLRTTELFGVPFHPGAKRPPTHLRGEAFDSTAVTGAFLMTSSDLFARSGGFDERYVAECQDIDYCLRLRRAGYRIGTFAVGPIIHIENATREVGEENWNDRALLVRRWSSFAECLYS